MGRNKNETPDEEPRSYRSPSFTTWNGSKKLMTVTRRLVILVPTPAHTLLLSCVSSETRCVRRRLTLKANDTATRLDR